MPSATTRTTPEQLYRLLADNATDVVTLHDIAGHYLYVSPSVQALGGYEPEQVIGESCWKFIHPDDIGSVQQAMARAVVEGQIVTFEYRWRHSDGRWEWVETTARLVGEEIQCSTRGVGERRAALARQSVVARLGDLVMRRPALDSVFDEAVATVAETLDIELVSIIEDIGDGRATVRAGVGWREGFVGSELEVVALRPGYTGGAATVLIGRPEAPMGVLTANTRDGRPFADVVVTDAGSDRGPEELLSDADAAMYQAKERGRRRYEMFDAGLRDRITARLRVEADLRRALEGEGRLWVAYQPYYRLPDRRVAGVEALVRWEHPELGNVPPAEFIPVAEESGLVVPLGARVLRAACEQVARWQRETRHEGLRLTVNVSARQMAAPDFVETVQSILAETGLHADSLGLEITEHLLLEETPGTALTIELLQALGVRLLLDDFGTGYSSLRYLQRYPLDGLKVDRAFVAGLGERGDGDGAIVEAIVGMARALGMGVIPEGIETDGQLQRLVAMGCDHAQGFLLSRPLPAQEIAALL